jgi:hypothetical protein
MLRQPAESQFAGWLATSRPSSRGRALATKMTFSGGGNEARRRPETQVPHGARAAARARPRLSRPVLGHASGQIVVFLNGRTRAAVP